MQRKYPTPKQAEFAKQYLVSGNASDAYRKCYDCSNMKDDAIAVNACRLLDNANVKLILDAASANTQQITERTLEKHLSKLEQLRDEAHSNGEFNNAIKSEELIGKALGFYTDHHSITNKTEQDVLDRLKVLDADTLIAHLKSKGKIVG